MTPGWAFRVKWPRNGQAGDGGDAERAAFWCAEHTSFLPVSAYMSTTAIPMKTKRWCWLHGSCNGGKAMPRWPWLQHHCWSWLQHHVGHGPSILLATALAPHWPWLQHHVGHDSSTTLIMASASCWPWLQHPRPQGLCRICNIHGENLDTNPVSVQVKRCVGAQQKCCVFLSSSYTRVYNSSPKQRQLLHADSWTQLGK